MPAPLIQEPIPQGLQAQSEAINRGQVASGDVDYNRLFNFSQARISLKALIDAWSTTISTTEQNRALRKLDIDSNVLEQQGKIDSDEMVIPTRTIDTNIKREQTVFIAYLQQSRRIATFTSTDDPALDTQVLEEAFSRGMTYEDWMIPHVKTIDGTQTHGWDSVEVVFDETKPLHVALEHIGHEKLIFPYDAVDIQHLETVIRLYIVTQPQLRQFVKEFGFNPQQVDRLLQKFNDVRKNESLTIYKQLFKYQGVVYTAWFEITNTDDWLLPPQKLYLGRKQKVQTLVDVPVGIDPMGMPIVQQQPQESWEPVDETYFPVFIFPYEQLEDPRIIMNQGRVFLDKAKQEALTAIASGIVNGITRASQVYASPEQGVGGRPMVNEDLRLIPNRVFTERLNFWSTPWPDPSAMSAFQMLGTYNDVEAGQVNYAAQNRQDSRKTAEEIKTATSEQSLLRSVQITNFSTWLRKIYSYAFEIVRSQALQGKIKFMSRMPEYLILDYDIRAAGDIDVIQRAEKLNRMKQDWPVIAATPLANPFLMDLLKISYPDEAARYQKVIQDGDIQKMWIQKVLPILPAIMEKIPQGIISPEELQQLAQIFQEGQQAITQL